MSIIQSSKCLCIGLFLLYASNLQGQKRKQKRSKSKVKAKQYQIAKNKQLNKSEQERLFFEGLNSYLLDRPQESLAMLLSYQKTDQQNSTISYLIAKIYLNLNLDLQAMTYIKKAIARDQTNLYYYDILITILSKAADYPKLINLYESLFQNISKLPPSYYLECIDLKESLEQYARALELILAAQERFGWLPELIYKKAQLYKSLKQYDKALATINELINQYPEVPNYRSFKADLLLSMKNYTQAEIYFKTVLKDNPEDQIALFNLCRLYIDTENKEKIYEIVEQIFTLNDFPIELKMIILFSLENLADRPVMLEFLHILSQKHPNNKEVNLTTASYLQEDNPREARLYFKKVLKQDPDNYDLWLGVIRLNFLTEDYKTLIADAQEALEYFPNKSKLYMILGNAYMTLKNYQKAKDNLEYGKSVLTNSFDFDKSELTNFNSYLADAHYNLDNRTKSFQLYQEVLDYDSNNVHALNNYSYYLSLEKEKLDLAKTMSSKLIQLAPNTPSYLDTYGWVLFQSNQFEDALKYLQKAVDLDDNPDPVILDHLADTFFKLNNKAKAIEFWKKALKTAESPEKELIQEKLSNSH